MHTNVQEEHGFLYLKICLNSHIFFILQASYLLSGKTLDFSLAINL